MRKMYLQCPQDLGVLGTFVPPNFTESERIGIGVAIFEFVF